MINKIIQSPFLSFPGKEVSFELAHIKSTHEFIELSSGELLSKNTLSNYNTFLRADNLLALKTLDSLSVKFHFIYIDPPYNSSSKFTYNDFHSSQAEWLAMIYPRLILAHKVLADDGIFFISIDDREQAFLTVLLREIFGRENHIGTLKWRKKRKPSFLDKHLSSIIEYVLIFSKNRNKLKKLQGSLSTEQTRPVLNASNNIALRVLQQGTKAFCPDGIYKAGNYKNRTLEVRYLEDFIIKNGILTNKVNIQGRFRVNQDILDKTVFITKQFGLRRKVLDEEQTKKHATDDATIGFETNEDGEVQLKSLFDGKKVFDFPKPVGLIKNLLNMYACGHEKILCLDFFAGSATFAQAVFEFDKDKYIFCCIQNEEPIQFSHSNMFKSVADIGQARIEALEKKYKIFPKCKIFSPKY